MAQRVVTEFIDDLDGETEAVETVSFGIDGATYEIDLNEAHAEELRTLLEGHAQHGRKLGRPDGWSESRTQAVSVAQPAEVDPKAVRQWAQDEGYEVSARGRVSKALLKDVRGARLVNSRPARPAPTPLTKGVGPA